MGALETALSSLGAPGWLIVAATVAIGLYHFREIIGLASRFGLVLKVGAVLVGMLIVADAGLVPGLHLRLQLPILLNWARNMMQTVLDFLQPHL